MKRLYVGNIPYNVSREEIEQGITDLFSEVTEVKAFTFPRDERKQGFVFADIEDDAKADEICEKFNGTDFMGRNLRVNEAMPQGERSFNRDRGGFGGGNRFNRDRGGDRGFRGNDRGGDRGGFSSQDNSGYDQAA